MPAERVNSISNPHKLLGSSHVKKKEPLAGNNRGCRGYVHIYTYFWKAIFLFSCFYSPGLRQILWSLLSWHCCCRFCGFCLLGFLVVLLLGFVGYLAAWFLVFFTCQCPHSWRHIAHLDRNYWFLVFFFSFFGWCCCFMEVMVWLTSVVLWGVYFKVSNLKMLGNAGKNCRRPKNKQVQQKTINVFLAQENNSSNMRPNAMWGQLQRQWKSQLSNDASTAQIKIGKQI